MAAARKTTNTTRSTSTAKADDTAKVEDTTPKTVSAEDKVEADATKPEADTSTAQEAEIKTETNPELEGGVDKVADAQREPEHDKATEQFLKEQDQKREQLLEEGVPTSEAYDDPHVNLADLPVNHDPVVTGDHSQASAAASVSVSKINEATPVQISQMDTSNFGNAVTDALSVHTVVEPKDESDKK